MQGQPTTFWGKLESDETTRQVLSWHPLVDHCADVAACCEALLQHTLLGTRLAQLGGSAALSSVQRARLGSLATFHDIGKFNLGFQNKALPRGANRCIAGHLSEAMRLLDCEHPPDDAERFWEVFPAEELNPWGEGLLELLVATISHHGRPIPFPSSIDHRAWRSARGLDPFSGIAELVDRVRAWFPEAWQPGGDPLPSTPAFQHAWSGLIMLGDWIGSDSERFFPFSDELGDRMPFARQRAAEALEQLGLLSGSARAAMGAGPPGFDAIAPGWQPRPLQRTVQDLEPAPGGSLAVLEAETGSGKTEAALVHFVKLFHAELVDGLYFALPTRTAATQIYRRVCEAAQHAFPDPETRPPVVLAVPGYLSVDGVTGQRLPGFEVLWNDDERERFRFRGWAAERSKRYLAGTIAVGTIDQVLLSALSVPHAHLRATALLRHLLVVDEVHASDAYMTRLLEAVLDQHLSARGHALLMSATLGAAARSRLVAPPGRRRRHAPPPLEEACDLPYPLLTSVALDRGARETRERAIERSGTEKEVEVEIERRIEEAAAIAERALGAAAEGAKVLVLRNTVNGCLEVQQALEELAAHQDDEGLLFRCGSVVAPHHGRFAATDRKLLDKAIEAAFGKHRPGGGCVVVATQTVEQSVDLDADLLITDLCPMDVLLQRVGRLHRHQRGAGERAPGYERARVVVLVPSEGLTDYITPDGEPRGPHGLGSVYEDLRVLELTRRIVMERAALRIPSDNRLLVELATHPERLESLVDELGDEWRCHRNHAVGKITAETRQGQLNLLRRDLDFTDSDVVFPEGSLARNIPTRLGENDRRVEFPEDGCPPSPFDTSAKIRELRIPQHRVHPATPADAQAEDLQHLPGAFEFRYGAWSYRYDRCGLRRLD